MNRTIYKDIDGLIIKQSRCIDKVSLYESIRIGYTVYFVISYIQDCLGEHWTLTVNLRDIEDSTIRESYIDIIVDEIMKKLEVENNQ